MKTLLEHEWIKIVGHKEVPGRPAIFASTQKFLDAFHFKSLEDLPPLLEDEAPSLEVAPEELGIEVAVEEVAL